MVFGQQRNSDRIAVRWCPPDPAVYRNGFAMIESRAPTPGGLSGIREVVRFVNRQKLIIFVPAVLIAGIAGTIASVMVPRYTATAALTLDVGKV